MLELGSHALVDTAHRADGRHDRRRHRRLVGRGRRRTAIISSRRDCLEQRRRERLHNEIREMVKAHVLRMAEECCRGPRFDAIVEEQTRGAFDPQRVAEQVVAEAFGVGEPMSPDHGFHPLRVKRIVQETHDTKSFVFDVPADARDDFAYEAGQFCTFRVRIGDEDLLRCYSMSSSPHTDADLTTTVKRVPGGRVSNWMLDEVAEGDVLVADPARRRVHLAAAVRADRRVQRRERHHPGDLGDQERAGHHRPIGAVALRQPQRRIGDLRRRARRADAPRTRTGSRSCTTSTSSTDSSTPTW